MTRRFAARVLRGRRAVESGGNPACVHAGLNGGTVRTAVPYGPAAPRHPPISATTASPTWPVDAVPPRSRVWCFGSATTVRQAAFTALAASF